MDGTHEAPRDEPRRHDEEASRDFESRTVEVDGVCVHARVSTTRPEREDVALVLVHGQVVSSRYLMPLARELAPNYRVYVPDLPGFGKSDKPQETLSLSELTDALAGFMAAVGLDDAVLVGNSFGCQIIAEFAVRHPERVQRAVLQGPTTDAAARSAPAQIARWLRTGMREPPTLMPILIKDYLEAGARRSIENYFENVLPDVIEEKLPRIKVPVLVVRGSDDDIVPQSWAEQVTWLLPRGRLEVVPGGAHTLNFTHPEQLAQLVRAFVGQAPSHLGPRPERVPAEPLEAPRAVADFDSSSAMMRATARFMRGQDFPGLGQSRWLERLAARANLLPERARELVYSVSGALEGVSASKLGAFDAEDLSRWIVSEYPQREVPAVAIGSMSGGMVHLCTALGIPLLPQTMLLPVRRGSRVDPNDMMADLQWGLEPGRRLLAGNPELRLYHMHDPNQDQLMIRYMTYFRIKRLRLGATFERYLRTSLSPGGTIFIVDCQRRWPALAVGERHYFQPGATGGLTAEEYLHGSPRVSAFLERYGAERTRWHPPEPDRELPEAEWGYEPALTPDIERFAAEHGYRVRRIVFDDVEDLSPLAADLYAWWYRQRGLQARRLLVEQFVMMEPWWTLRAGCVPFWTRFGVETSAACLERYLDGLDEPFDEIHTMLFSHGTDSAGLAPSERWQRLQERARVHGAFVGVDPDAFPRDFAAFGRYHGAMTRLGRCSPMPEPLALDDLERFLDGHGERYPVRFR